MKYIASRHSFTESADVISVQDTINNWVYSFQVKQNIKYIAYIGVVYEASEEEEKA